MGGVSMRFGLASVPWKPSLILILELQERFHRSGICSLHLAPWMQIWLAEYIKLNLWIYLNINIFTPYLFLSVKHFASALHKFGSGQRSSGVWPFLFFRFRSAPFAARKQAIEALEDFFSEPCRLNPSYSTMNEDIDIKRDYQTNIIDGLWDCRIKKFINSFEILNSTHQSHSQSFNTSTQTHSTDILQVLKLS